MKKVSIIMGIYNCENTLEESIESILKQTYKNWELIMCDDGSTDTTKNIAREYSDRYDQVKLLENNVNKGLAYSLNRCIENSTGEYIARMDGDDISLPNRLEEQINYLDRNEKIDILGSNMYYFDETGIWGKSYAKLKLDKIDIACGRVFAHPTVVMRKRCLESVQGYRSNKLTYRAEDYDLWCRLYEAGFKGENLDQYLFKYRLDKHAYKKRKYKYRIDEFRLKRYWHKRFKISVKYSLFYVKPLIVGMIPGVLIKKYHSAKFNG